MVPGVASLYRPGAAVGSNEKRGEEEKGDESMGRRWEGLRPGVASLYGWTNLEDQLLPTVEKVGRATVVRARHYKSQ